MPTLCHNVYRIYWKCQDSTKAFKKAMVTKEKKLWIK